MAVVFEAGYTLPAGARDLRGSRIAYDHITGTLTASTAATGFDADNAETDLSYLSWKPTASPATWGYESLTNITADYCCIGSHDLGSQSATVTVQQYDGAIWNDVVSVSPTDNSDIFFIFEPVEADGWRVSITYSGDAPKAGRIAFGQALQMPSWMYQGNTPIQLARQTEFLTTRSEGGKFLGRRVKRKGLQGSYTWEHITKSIYDTEVDPWVLSARENAFFVAWNPLRDPLAAAMVWATSEIDVTNSGPVDFRSVTLNWRAEAYE